MNQVSPKRLGDILNLKRGYDLTESQRIAGDYPVISSAGISGYHSEYKVEGEGVVIGRYGTLGEAHFVQGRYWPHNTSLYVTDFKGNSPKYIYYLLTCIGRIRASDKSAVPGVNRNELHEMLVPALEDRRQQDKIADVLSKIDAKISLNIRINEELEKVAKLVYDYWFVQFDFPIGAEQAATMGNPSLEGKPYCSSGGKMVYNDCLKRDIPEGWDAGNLERLGTIIGGSTPSTEAAENFAPQGTPWITPKDLSDNEGNRFIDHGAIDVTPQGIKSASLKLLPAGTVLMSSRAPIGYVAVSQKTATTNQGFKSIIPDNGFSTDYVYFTVKHYMKLIKANASGSTFKEISGGTLKVVKIPFPSQELAREFSAFALGFSSQQAILEQQNRDLRKLRNWLLPMLMNGQLTVR